MSIPKAATKLNDGQKAALDLNRDLLVMAGAGAGKTEVLGLRILALIEHGRARIQDIVAFTFTNKAAAEMRERVQLKLMERIAELSKEGDVERRDLLIQARRDFDKNRITTMHSFCQRLLNEYAWEVGLEPNAQLLDERQQKQARDAAARRIMLQTDEAAEPEIAAALQQLGRIVKPAALGQALKQILRDRDVLVGAISDAADAWSNFDTELERRTKYALELERRAASSVSQLLPDLNWAAIESAKNDDDMQRVLLATRTLFNKKSGIVAGLIAMAPSILGSSFNAIKHGRTGKAANWGKGELKLAREAAFRISSAVEENFGPLLKLMFDPDHEQHVGESLISLNTLTSRLLEIYTEERAGRLDFSELEIAAIKLLTGNPQTREEVQARIKYLLIDEFQDTNPTQEQLFRSLISDNDARGRFFAVGDAKQAIYGFRRSDVRIFRKFEEDIQARNESLANTPQELAWGMGFVANQTDAEIAERQRGIVKLTVNYRTVSDTLNAGNRFFNDIFTVEKPEAYDPKPQDMEVGSTLESADKPVEIHILKKEKRTKESEETGSRANNRDAEATLIAKRILDLTQNHDVQFKDITILVRRATRNHVYRKVFARAGIPLLVRGETGLFHTQEALDCINLLRVLARPSDDVALIGLLRSPFVGIKDTWLTQMGMGTDDIRGTSLMNRVQVYVKKSKNDEEELKRLLWFLEVLKNLRQRAGRDHPVALLQEAIAETGYLLAVQNGPASEQRKANVLRMLELVRELQQQLPSLAILVRDLETRAEQGDPETQGVPEGSFDGVELMTIHKSKGLAFGTVFIPDLGIVSKGGMFPPMICELPDEGGQLGLRLHRFDEARRGQQRPDLEGWLAEIAADLRSASEEKRVLYVAYTRAIDRVIMVGSCSKGVSENSWAGQLLSPHGATDFGDEVSESLPFTLNWHEQIERLAGHPNQSQLDTLNDSLQSESLNLSSAIDASCVPPLTKNVPAKRSHNHEATEFGTVLHAELEKRIRCGSKNIEFGIVSLNDDLTRQADNGMAALATLPKARQLPEFGVVAPEGRCRIDLLRDLGDGHFQIVDYKTDAVGSEEIGSKAEEHRDQLEGYRDVFSKLLQSRGEPVNSIELFVCFTAPQELQPKERLVKLS